MIKPSMSIDASYIPVTTEFAQYTPISPEELKQNASRFEDLGSVPPKVVNADELSKMMRCWAGMSDVEFHEQAKTNKTVTVMPALEPEFEDTGIHEELVEVQFEVGEHRMDVCMTRASDTSMAMTSAWGVGADIKSL